MLSPFILIALLVDLVAKSSLLAEEPGGESVEETNVKIAGLVKSEISVKNPPFTLVSGCIQQAILSVILGS